MDKSYYRIILKWMFVNWRHLSVQQRRRRMAFYDLLSPVNRSLNVSESSIGNVHTTIIRPNKPAQAALLYLHGGAYVLGMTNNHINLCGKIAHGTGLEVMAPHYRLAPEHPYPGALEDVFSVYCSLINHTDEGKPFFLGGDSAGGGLALALLHMIRKADMSMPRGVFLFSPWTDLTCSGESFSRNQEKDPVLTSGMLSEDAKLYAGDTPLNDPGISPLFASLQGFPFLYVQVGSEEILLDDSLMLVRHALQQGVKAELEVWQGMFHVFQSLPMLEESESAVQKIVEFIDSLKPESQA